jgi:hypothetical protein
LKADHNECTRAQKPEKENIKKVKVDASFASRVGENLLFSIQTREREREREMGRREMDFNGLWSLFA